MRYTLMNKDKALAYLEIEKNTAYITDIIGTLPGYIGNIYTWIEGRTSPIGRENINYLLKLAGIRNKAEYIEVTHGISLIDTFWLKKDTDTITWDKINPYKNRFSRIISEICLNGQYNYNGELRSPSPDYKLDGSVDKCWKRENGNIWLYKTAGECWNSFSGLRPYMEYYASQVASELIPNKTHYVPYSIKVSITNNGYRKPYCVCPIFTTEQYGLLQYGESKFKGTDLETLDNILDTRSKIILREMLVLDSLILNHDRHDLNYGFYVDNDTYRIKGMSPIYDNDCSLGYFVSLQSVDSLQEGYKLALQRQPKTEMGSYVEQARWAMTKELYQNIKNMYPFHFKRLPSNIDIEDERIEFMEYIVNNQIKAILGN